MNVTAQDMATAAWLQRHGPGEKQVFIYDHINKLSYLPPCRVDTVVKATCYLFIVVWKEDKIRSNTDDVKAHQMTPHSSGFLIHGPGPTKSPGRREKVDLHVNFN